MSGSPLRLSAAAIDVTLDGCGHADGLSTGAEVVLV
jgi:hypothetical protein